MIYPRLVRPRSCRFHLRDARARGVRTVKKRTLAAPSEFYEGLAFGRE